MVSRVAMVAGVQGNARGWPFQASHAHNQANHLVAGLVQNLDTKIPDFGIQDISWVSKSWTWIPKTCPRRAAMVVRVTMVAGVQGKARGWPFRASHAHNQASHLVAGLVQNLDTKIAVHH